MHNGENASTWQNAGSRREPQALHHVRQLGRSTRTVQPSTMGQPSTMDAAGLPVEKLLYVQRSERARVIQRVYPLFVIRWKHHSGGFDFVDLHQDQIATSFRRRGT